MLFPNDVTVAIPAHQARVNNGMLSRAFQSVAAQTWSPAAVSVAIDTGRQGAAATRQRALEGVLTPWVAFLDSDDEFLPEHLERVMGFLEETGADFCYSWFEGTNGFDPFPMNFGKPFDPANPVETTSTIIVKTELAREVRFERLPERLHNSGEDWRFLTRCIELGAKIVHLPAITWRWNIHSGNTSGLPDRGDAAQ